MSIEHLKTGDLVPKPPEPRSEAEIMGGWKGGPDTPLVSIVCHTYNHVHFIKDALNGFLTQETSFPFEIILNDDASTDGTQDIVKAYQNQYPRLIRATLHAENNFSKGLSPRNFSFPKVRGTYIALCEGDDFWHSPVKLQLQIEAFEGGISLVFHDAITFSDGRVISSSYFAEGKCPENGYNEIAMARGVRVPTASAVFLSSPFLKSKHENVINGDHLIWATMAGLGRAKFLSETMSAYRFHPGGVWSARKTIDKLDPVMHSKLTIFSIAKKDLKAAVLLGTTSECISLTKKLREEGEVRASVEFYRMNFFRFFKMLPYCSFVSLSSLDCLARSAYHLITNAKLLIGR